MLNNLLLKSNAHEKHQQYPGLYEMILQEYILLTNSGEAVNGKKLWKKIFRCTDCQRITHFYLS